MYHRSCVLSPPLNLNFFIYFWHMPVIDFSSHYMKWDNSQGLYIDILKHTHMRNIIENIIFPYIALYCVPLLWCIKVLNWIIRYIHKSTMSEQIFRSLMSLISIIQFTLRVLIQYIICCDGKSWSLEYPRPYTSTVFSISPEYITYNNSHEYYQSCDATSQLPDSCRVPGIILSCCLRIWMSKRAVQS